MLQCPDNEKTWYNCIIKRRWVTFSNAGKANFKGSIKTGK